MGANDPENCPISVCPACKLHKCWRIGLTHGAISGNKRLRSNTTDTSGFGIKQWFNNFRGFGNSQGHSGTNNSFNRHPTQSFSQPLNTVTNHEFETTQSSEYKDQGYQTTNCTSVPPMNTANIQSVHGGQYHPNSIANNDYNFGTNSTGNRNDCMDTTSSHLVTNSINTDNNILHPVLQDLLQDFDFEWPTNEGPVGQGLEYTYVNGTLPQQQPQQSTNTSTAVESYETPLVLQTNATNNILRNQMDNSVDNTVYDMIHTLISKINLGLITATNEDPLLAKMKEIQIYENKGQQMIKAIADELMQKGPDELKQLLARAGPEVEAVIEMYITKEPWECTTDVELKVTKAPELRSGNSRYFQMNSHPRGRAIIFVTTDGLDVEIKRWKSIFAQLDFKCEVYVDFTCSEIKDKLLGVSCQRFVADALLVMVIGGGFDQKIYGYGKREVDNEMSFTEIVDIFSANNPKSDVSLRMKPKIFVFNTFSM
ncbi:unnamed protein product, partial [Oppiella nova]